MTKLHLTVDLSSQCLQILERSGIGGKEVLDKAGVKTLVSEYINFNPRYPFH
jgi:hypothetical protein